MELNGYVDTVREQLAVAAAAGGQEARDLVERLTAPLDATVRLVLLGALSAAAAEITRELAPGSVDVRLRGLEPTFVVTAAIVPDAPDEPDPMPLSSGPRASPDGDDAAMTRINLRLAEDLKADVEEAARQAGLSVNGWLVRAAASALAGDRPRRTDRGVARGSDRYTGWVH